MPTFYVNEAAGEVVAGVKNPGVDQPLELTAGQAEHPLRLGHIRAGGARPTRTNLVVNPPRGKHRGRN